MSTTAEIREQEAADREHLRYERAVIVCTKVDEDGAGADGVILYAKGRLVEIDFRDFSTHLGDWHFGSPVPSVGIWVAEMELLNWRGPGYDPDGWEPDWRTLFRRLTPTEMYRVAKGSNPL